MFKKIITSPFFIFPVITCIVFWPLSLAIFTLKNDALTYYYPIRTLISDALNNHELPLWTPFINMGYPIGSDMQSCAWNPIIWVFSFLTHYSLAAFHYELLFYLSFAGIGFYYLCREYKWSRTTALLIAFAYELSGPIIDSMQFATFISSACYIPFIFLFFRRLFLYQQWKDALAAALFLYLLFTGGYPSFFIIIAYLLLAYGLFYFFSADNKMQFLKNLLLPLTLVGLLFIALSLPAIISYAQLLQHIDRGQKQGLDFILQNSMPPACLFSLISPFSTTATAPFFNTDLLMRSSYIGIIPLLFVIVALVNKTVRANKEVRFFLITALILFGMAFGSHFFLRQLAYYALPLMNTFRHPAMFRMFGSMFLLLTAGYAFNQWGENKSLSLKKIIKGFVIAVLLVSIFVAAFSFNKLLPSSCSTTNLKSTFAQLNFQQRFFIQLPFIIAILYCFYFIVDKKKALRYILFLSVADLFFAAQLNIPITVIGAKKFTTIKEFINRTPLKFPLPGNATIEENSAGTYDSSLTVGSKLVLQKKIGRNSYYIVPGNLASQENFYNSPIRNKVFKNPVLYFADISLSNTDSVCMNNKASSINITHFSANKMECETGSDFTSYLVYLQNDYPGWEASVDNEKTPIVKANITFMAIKVAAGKHKIIFNYHPKTIIYAWYISLITLMIVLVSLLWSIKRSFLFNNHN